MKESAPAEPASVEPKSRAEWRRWLEENHARAKCVCDWRRWRERERGPRIF